MWWLTDPFWHKPSLKHLAGLFEISAELLHDSFEVFLFNFYANGKAFWLSFSSYVQIIMYSPSLTFFGSRHSIQLFIVFELVRLNWAVLCCFDMTMVGRLNLVKINASKSTLMSKEKASCMFSPTGHSNMLC